MRAQQKALPLDKIAACLTLLSNRLERGLDTCDETLRGQLGRAVLELRVLRDTIAARLAANDARTESLMRIDAALCDLDTVLVGLMNASAAENASANVLAFPRKSRTAAARISLRRALLVLGVSTAAAGVAGFAVPAAAESATTPTYIGMTPQDIGVMERVRPEYDAKGIPMGGFRMFPSLDVNGVFDDNVFRSTPASSDYYFEEAPTVRIKSQWGRHFLEVYGGIDNFNYSNFSQLDLTDWTIGADGRYDASRAMDFSAAFYYGEYHEGMSSPNVVTFQASPNQYYKTHAEGVARFQPNRLGISVGGSYDRYDWQLTPKIGGGFLSNVDRDMGEYQGYVKATYDFSPGYTGFVKGLYDSRQFDLPLDRTGVNRDSTGYRFDAGLNLQISHLLAGEIFIGYLSQNHAAPLKNVSGVDFGIGLDWFATPVLTVHLDGSRQLSDTTLAGVSASDDKIFKLSADYEFRRNIIVQGYVSYTASEQIGTTPRNDNYPGAGISIKYMMNRYMSADVNYNYNERSSSTAALDYTDNMIGVGLSLHI